MGGTTKKGGPNLSGSVGGSKGRGGGHTFCFKFSVGGAMGENYVYEKYFS